MIYPADTHAYIRVARFLNLLDDADNKLSPVKIQAWTSTISAAATMFTHDHLATGLGIMWAGCSHVTHLMDKRWRATYVRAS